jgi:energy-converting hydrogenase Eha subunit F
MHPQEKIFTLYFNILGNLGRCTAQLAPIDLREQLNTLQTDTSVVYQPIKVLNSIIFVIAKN